MLDKHVFIPMLLERVANTENIATLTEQLLEHIGRATGADRVYVFELTPIGSLSNTHEWCREGVSPQKHNLQDMPLELLGPWKAEFRRSGSVVIRDLEAYGEECREIYDILRPQGIHSLVVCPLMLHGRHVGFFGVDNPPQKGIDAIMDVLSELRHTLVIMLRCRAMMQEMARMCFRDQLTGARNRHALMHEGAGLDADRSIGFVLCDTNGLKEVNDVQGHDAGDALLVGTASALFEAFGRMHVYRIGGDEFVAFHQGDSEAGFRGRLERLRAAFEKHRVHVAVGPVFLERAETGVEDLLKLADARMYEDKRRFYEDRGGKPAPMADPDGSGRRG